MQEHGVPVTYAYISDAHDNHPSGPAYGPGQAGYVAALKAYDTAFDKFFTRLAADGINASNTEFVFTSDEGDHFVGGAPSPANCDGVTVPCTYSKIGEINANLAGLLATQQNNTTPFKVHSDDAPTYYIQGNPMPNSPVARNLERAVGKLTSANPMTGGTDTITRFLADPVEEKILHMVTSDPMRTPNFTQFADPNYFLFAGAPNCNSPCVTQNPAFAWNHGDVQADIVTTWLGMVGPGIKPGNLDSTTWSDHTDIRSTLMALTGLQDDYTHDGRVLVEALQDAAIPNLIRNHRDSWLQLAQTFKQLNASVGQFAASTLSASTAGIMSNDPGDAGYAQMEGKLYWLGVQRNALAGQIAYLLDRTSFSGADVSDLTLVALNTQAQSLIAQAMGLAPAS
jgi:hypothetical protein